MDSTLAVTWIRHSPELDRTPSHTVVSLGGSAQITTNTSNTLDFPFYSGLLSIKAKYFGPMGDRYKQGPHMLHSRYNLQEKEILHACTQKIKVYIIANYKNLWSQYVWNSIVCRMWWLLTGGRLHQKNYGALKISGRLGIRWNRDPALYRSSNWKETQGYPGQERFAGGNLPSSITTIECNSR